MKIIYSICMSLLTLSIFGQKVEYDTGVLTYEDRQVETIKVILSPEVSTIKDKFKDWMSDHYDVKLDRKKLLFFEKEYMSAEGVVIPQISDRKMDLRVKVTETEKGFTKLDVFAAYGYDNYITPNNHPWAYDSLKEIVHNFIDEYLPEYYYEKVEETEEKISDIKNDSDNISDELADNKKEIEDLMNKNEELRKELDTNRSKLKKASLKLQSRKSEYEKIKKKVSSNKE